MLFEQPFVQSITTTIDGRYVVAATGSDKTIWVFEHDGAGGLKQLSSRTMPKRPCSIAITPDPQTILSADKFGDVYAVPLLQSALDQQADPKEPTPTATSRSVTPSTAPQPFKPQANEFTVHTKRNLRALENQKLGLQTKGGAAADKPAEPTFEHTLLLGHVSMLTAVLVAVHPATQRAYIVTGDRDEHIRVSRGAPAQAHIIETFCLGHEDFVSRLVLPAPAARPELLVSGGGDDHLFVWDWTRGALLSKASVLAHVQQVVSGQRNIAVSRLYACPAGGGGEDGSVLVFVVCERVPALFCFELKGNTLHHHTTIPTPGPPLDMANMGSGSSSSSPRLLLAVDVITAADSQGGSSLFWVDCEAALGWRLRSCQETSVVAGDDEPALKPEDLQKILYTTESLRKTTDFE